MDWRRSRAPGPPPHSQTRKLLDAWIAIEPERAWPLLELLVRLRPNDADVLERVWSFLRGLLARHGRAFEPRVRALVGSCVLLARIVPPAQLDRRAHRPRPPDIPALVDAYLLNATQGHDAHELDDWIRNDPVVGLRVALEIISRGPLHGFGSRETRRPLEELLKTHGAAVIGAVEDAAAESALVRRALWRISRLRGHPPGEYDIPADLWRRAERAIAGTTDYNSGNPPGIAHPLLPEEERAVEAWFVYERTFWAWGKMQDMVRLDPDPAWHVLGMLVDGAGSDDVLELLGAGPLEDLMSLHGEHFVDRAVGRARADESFRFALSCMWQADMTDEVWTRVQSVLEEF
jgi:hypothetical protein